MFAGKVFVILIFLFHRTEETRTEFPTRDVFLPGKKLNATSETKLNSEVKISQEGHNRAQGQVTEEYLETTAVSGVFWLNIIITLFHFYNMFYKNIEAKMCEIARIFWE